MKRGHGALMQHVRRGLLGVLLLGMSLLGMLLLACLVWPPDSLWEARRSAVGSSFAGGFWVSQAQAQTPTSKDGNAAAAHARGGESPEQGKGSGVRATLRVQWICGTMLGPVRGTMRGPVASDLRHHLDRELTLHTAWVPVFDRREGFDGREGLASVREEGRSASLGVELDRAEPGEAARAVEAPLVLQLRGACLEDTLVEAASEEASGHEKERAARAPTARQGASSGPRPSDPSPSDSSTSAPSTSALVRKERAPQDSPDGLLGLVLMRGDHVLGRKDLFLHDIPEDDWARVAAVVATELVLALALPPDPLRHPITHAPDLEKGLTQTSPPKSVPLRADAEGPAGPVRSVPPVSSAAKGTNAPASRAPGKDAERAPMKTSNASRPAKSKSSHATHRSQRSPGEETDGLLVPLREKHSAWTLEALPSIRAFPQMGQVVFGGGVRLRHGAFSLGLHGHGGPKSIKIASARTRLMTGELGLSLLAYRWRAWTVALDLYGQVGGVWVQPASDRGGEVGTLIQAKAASGIYLDGTLELASKYQWRSGMFAGAFARAGYGMGVQATGVEVDATSATFRAVGGAGKSVLGAGLVLGHTWPPR